MTEEIKEEENTELEPHPDRPAFKDFCILLCESEIMKLDDAQRQAKQMRKKTIKLQNEIKAFEGDDFSKVLEGHQLETFNQMYDQLNVELHKTGEMIAERVAKMEAFDKAIEDQGINLEGVENEDD